MKAPSNTSLKKQIPSSIRCITLFAALLPLTAVGQAPTISALHPADGSYTFGSRENILIASFDRPVGVNQGGSIEIRDLTDGSSTQIIQLPDPRVTFDKGTRMSINLGDKIDLGTEYSIRISKDALSSGEGKAAFAGIQDDTTWNFSTVKKLHNVLLVTIGIKDGPPNRTVKQGLGELFHNQFNADEALRINSYGGIGLVLGDGSDKPATVEISWPELGPDAHRKKNLRHRAMEELAKRGYDLNQYRFVCYVLPRIVSGPDGSAAVGGQWSNYKVFWVNTINHEIGHCLGMQHSQGDPACVMGDIRSSGYNAATRDHVGWLKPFPGAVAKITESGSHTLVPLSPHPDRVPGLRVIHIPLAKGDSLCVSYRVNKITKYAAMKHGDRISKTVQISYLPPKAVSRNHFKAGLMSGQKFEYQGVTITCDSIAEDGMSAKISIKTKP